MSDNNDDTLLEGDLGDDVDYDLANEEEDALLADDYDIQGSGHQTIYLQQEKISEIQDSFQREPEEPDDVLDLGVTEGDVLDDLDSELQESQEQTGSKTVQEYDDSAVVQQQMGHLESSAASEVLQDTTDQSHLLETNYVETEHVAEDDTAVGAESEEEEEETAEARDRFKSERKTVVSLKNSTKSYGNIPDSLDNVCVEDPKQAGRGAWRGRRGRGFGNAGRGRQHLHPGGNFKNEGPNNFNIHPHQDPQHHQQAFGGPHFMPHAPGAFLRPPGRGTGRGIGFGRSGMEQQQYQQQQPPQQQGPHKILINPHFRGAVQPRPDARLIWDTEMSESQGMPGHIPQGDGFAPYPQGIQQMEPAFQPPPQGPAYVADQYSAPRYATPPQIHQPGFYHDHDPYSEQQHLNTWQDDSQRIGGEMYMQNPQGPPPMESGTMVMGPPQQEQVFHPHPNHIMNDHAALTAHPGQPGPAFGGMVHGQPYQGSDQYHDDGNYPLAGLPPPPPLHVQQEPHYHHHPHQQPAMMSPGNPPPVRRLHPGNNMQVEPNVWHCTTDGSTASGDGLHMVSPAQPVAPHYSTQGVFRLPRPGQPGVKIRQQGMDHQGDVFGNNQRVVRMGRFPMGRGQLKGLRPQLQQNRGRRLPLHTHQQPPVQQPQIQQQQQQQQPQQQQQQQLQLQQIRLAKKRQSFEGTGNVGPFKQSRFDPAVKRKKRMPDMSNLHEVQTVELPSDTQNAQQMETVQQSEEEEDEETREYRKKIEEQKRIREEFLQKKEARRKAAARVKQLQLQQKDVDLQADGDTPVESEPPQGNAIATIVNRNTVEPQPASIPNQVVRQVLPKQLRVQQPIQVQARLGTPAQSPQQNAVAVVAKRPQGAIVGGRGMLRGRGIVRGRGAIMAGRGPHQVQIRPQVPVQQQKPQQTAHILAAATPTPPGPVMKVITKAPVPGQRIVRASGTPVVTPQPAGAQPRRLVVAQGIPHQVRQAAPQQQVSRTVVLRGANGGKIIQQQTSQQPQRIVVANKQQTTGAVRQAVAARAVVATQKAATNQETLKPTKLVSIENLAASTTEQQLKRMCQDVGGVESIQMLPAQRRAMLKFANPKSALTFFQRYQRKIVDLSLITVKLVYQ